MKLNLYSHFFSKQQQQQNKLDVLLKACQFLEGKLVTILPFICRGKCEAYNRGQNLWNNVKKLSKTGQDKKTLKSVFA